MSAAASSGGGFPATWGDAQAPVDSAARWAMLDSQQQPAAAPRPADAGAVGDASLITPETTPTVGTGPLRVPLLPQPLSQPPTQQQQQPQQQPQPPMPTSVFGAASAGSSAAVTPANSSAPMLMQLRRDPPSSTAQTQGPNATNNTNISSGSGMGSNVQLLGYLPDGRPVFAPAPSTPGSSSGPVANVGAATPSAAGGGTPTIRVGPAPVPVVMVGKTPSAPTPTVAVGKGPTATPTSSAAPTPAASAGVPLVTPSAATPSVKVTVGPAPTPTVRVGQVSAGTTPSAAKAGQGDSTAAVVSMPLSERPASLGASSASGTPAPSPSKGAVRPALSPSVGAAPLASPSVRVGGPATPQPTVRVGGTQVAARIGSPPVQSPTAAVTVGSGARPPAAVSPTAAGAGPSVTAEPGIIYFSGKQLVPAGSSGNPAPSSTSAPSGADGSAAPDGSLDQQAAETNAWARFAATGATTTTGAAGAVGEPTLAVPPAKGRPKLNLAAPVSGRPGSPPKGE